MNDREFMNCPRCLKDTMTKHQENTPVVTSYIWYECENCGDIDEEMIELRKLLDWIDNLRAGHFGFTIKADSGFSNDLDESLNIIENLIQNWNS